MSRALLVLAVFLAVLLPSPSAARLGSPSPREISDSITELDVQRARELLSHVDADSNAVALERARLSLYVGDCDAAGATLATLSGVKEAGPLSELARTCARATAGSLVVEDAGKGLWIRLQDAEDRVLVPFLSDVAARARAAIERDLGVVMPRPLRIDLVRDLFSLSAVSGLPLDAAETTGTVAVARWGRVTMISPRAAFTGYPWEDTLAHEITHLALTRATRDGAPLWLQEGLAKRQEIRWRAPQPFDGDPPADTVARDALLSGESVGVDKLGPSIAMLPSADAASIAFAEVSSFVGYLSEQVGRPALRMLFTDLKQLGPTRASDALRSISGYDLPAWITRWRAHLLASPDAEPRAPSAAAVMPSALAGISQPIDARERARSTRLSDLLFQRGAARLASIRLRPVVASSASDPVLRFRLGRSLIAEGSSGEAEPLFRSPEGLDVPYAGWFAFEGRFLREANRSSEARAALDLALALDPYLEEAACEGMFVTPGSPEAGPGDLSKKVPGDPNLRALCEAARKVPRD